MTRKSGSGLHQRAPVPYPTTATPRVWPDSFLTGPLGAANILPTTATGAFLGSQFGGYGYSKSQERSQLVSRQTAMGRAYDIFHFHYDGGGTYGGVFGCEDPTDTLGSAPGGITQEQYGINNGSYSAAVWSPNYTIAQVNAGTADAIFTKMGTYWATYKPNKIMLRLFHEFDAASFTWGFSGGVPTGANFVLAWQRAVGLIQAAGGTNVGFWWCPNEYLGGLTRTALNAYYPGDAYVDWVGSDIYNHNTGQSTPLHTLWADWWELFNYGQDWATDYCHYDIYSRSAGDPLRAISGAKTFVGTTYTKPFVVGECSTPYDSGGITTRKATWLTNVTGHAKALSAMSHMVGICFYDADVSSAPGSDFDWRLCSDASVPDVVGTDPDPTTQAGFVSMAQATLLRGR